MNFSDAEKLSNKLRAHPVKTTFVLLVLAVLIAVTAYISEYFREKGKQHSVSSNADVRANGELKGTALKEKTKSGGVTINQSTRGDQSPAVVSGGNVTIEYDPRKENNGKE
jgi:hypothetical protein